MLVSFVFCLCLLLLMDTSLFLKLAIEELIASESDYLVTLQLIIDGYYRPTKSCISPLELKNNLTTIFGNILDIYQFHSDFFSPQLKECESISDITQCFSCNIANFNIYTLYCSNKYQSSRFLNFYNGNFFKVFPNFNCIITDITIFLNYVNSITSSCYYASLYLAK